MPATVHAPTTVPRSLPPFNEPHHQRSRWPWVLGAGSLMLVISPVVLLAGAGNPPCQTTASAGLETLAGARAPGGMYAQPLKLNAGRWYEVGATEYGGPGDPTAKSSGAIGGTQGYLPAHPDSFAELSVLDTNPADRGSFTFADANALDNLPYMTGLLVANGRAKRILYKRDVGYGQGPGQTIANGQPYRLDVWWQPASALGISRSPVKITLAPPVGAGNLLQETTLAASTGETANPACDQLAATGMLQLTPGQQARILSDGSAAAPQDAPAAVKRAIAAANQIHTKPYSVNPGGAPEHYGPLATPWPAYDCSGTVSYVLYKAGLHSANADVSGSLETWGQPGPGKWITVYANSGHTWIVIAGLAFDTADFGGPNLPAGSGPRWRQNPTANLGDGLSYVIRHPAGL